SRWSELVDCAVAQSGFCRSERGGCERSAAETGYPRCWIRDAVGRVVNRPCGVRVRIEIGPVGDIEEISLQLHVITLVEMKIFRESRVPLKVPRLIKRIPPQQKRLAVCACKSRSVVIVTIVGCFVTVYVYIDVQREQDARVSDQRARHGETPWQVVNSSRLELMSHVEPVPAIVQVDVSRVLRTEIGVGVALARGVVLVPRPDVVRENLEVIRKPLIDVHND